MKIEATPQEVFEIMCLLGKSDTKDIVVKPFSQILVQTIQESLETARQSPQTAK